MFYFFGTPNPDRLSSTYILGLKCFFSYNNFFNHKVKNSFVWDSVIQVRFSSLVRLENSLQEWLVYSVPPCLRYFLELW